MIKYLSKVLFILAGARKQLILLVTVFILSSALEAVGIGLIGPFLWLASNPEAIIEISPLNWLYTLFSVDSPDQFIAWLGLALAVVFCLKSVLYFLARSHVTRFALEQRSKLICSLLNAYLSAPYTFFLDDKNSTATLIGRMTKDAEDFCHQCIIPLLELVSNLVTTAILIAILAQADPVLLLMILCVLLPTFLVFYSLKSRASGWGKEATESHRDMIRIIHHSLGGIKETRVIGCAPYFEAQMHRTSKRNVDAVTGAFSLQILPRIAIETLIIVLVVSVVSLSQLLFSRSVDEVLPILSVFAVASIRLIPAYSQSLTSWAMLQTSRHAVTMLHADLKTLRQQGLVTKRLSTFVAPQSHATPKSPLAQNSLMTAEREPSEALSFEQSVELQNVTYFYPRSAQPAIDNISLSLKKGQSIALIGKSGAGKTTLVDVILGLLEPSQGDICVDGTSIYPNLRSWQNLIGYIPQSIFLMDDTLEHNVAYGLPDDCIDPVRLQRAIDAAQLTELVEHLPQGVKTPVGERGVRLSGGQRQRVGIARALYHGRDILVLDEATAALDNETERLVTESIQSLSGMKTMIIIAHRLTTVKHCDRIYVVEKGRIVNSGSYQEVVGEIPVR